MINFGRFALAAVAATVVDAGYGFLVYGLLLHDQFAAHPGVYRPEEVAGPYMPYIFLGTFIAMIAATYIYVKGYEGGGGLQEGLGFGVALGVFALGYDGIVNYAVLNIGRRLGCSMAIAGFAEWLLAGIVIGLVYKPAAGIAAAQA
jgi:hypothetical protein